MLKKIITTVSFFFLFLLPVVALSFLAFTVFHQVILFTSVFLFGWAAFYIGNIWSDRERLSREVFMQSYELKKSKEALASCLVNESQTQVHSARLLEARLTEECERARRYQRPLSFLLVCIDDMPELVKLHGATFPDVIIHEVVEFLKECTRSVDLIIRKGENRFFIILPETKLDQTRMVAERIRYGVEKKSFRIGDKAYRLTVCVGFSSFDASIFRNKDDVIDMLERAIINARKVGPNRIATLAGELSS